METQAEAPHKHTNAQVSGCSECRSLALAVQGDRGNTCDKCEQVNDLLSLMADLKEEVERLTSIRECEKEVDWWSQP